MATNGNNLEPEFDALLKAHVKQQTNRARCHQFDPDNATAYLERALNKTALITYEEHLASCADCRRHLVELSRLMPTQTIASEPVITQPSLKERWSEWFSGWRLGALAGLSAVAATALLVAVVMNRQSANTAINEIAASKPAMEIQATPADSPASAVEPSAQNANASAAPSASIAPKQDRQKEISQGTQTNTANTPPVIAGASSEAASPPPPPAPTPAPSAAKLEVDGKEVAANQTKAIGANQGQNFRVIPQSGPEVNQLQVERAMELKKQEMRPGVAADIVAPKPAKPASKSSAESEEGFAISQRSEVADEAGKRKDGARSSAPVAKTAARSTPPGKTVGGKTFRQENGVWVDNEYNPKSGSSVIRLTNESDAYKQTLKDNPGLKPYFDLKPVIVVWQGKVYRVEN